MTLKAAYVTLLTKTSYLPGTLVLDHGLRSVQSRYPLVVMVTPSLPKGARDVLERRGIKIREVDTLKPEEGAHKLAAHDERFADTWTKLRGFELIEYDRIVLLDCDMIVMKNMDELMHLDLTKEQIAAAHVCACNPRKLKHYPADWIPENCAHTAVTHPAALPPPATEDTPRPYSQLNSGTVVINPSKELSEAIIHFLSTHDKIAEFSFPDQDLLTAFFKGRWKPISWYYNALRTLRFVHPDEWSDDEVRCLHYILPDKPWQSRVTPKESEKQLGLMNEWWWQHFDNLGEEMGTIDPEGWELVTSHVDNVQV
ncbi:Galactinol synthase 2 [Hypsizygus marmoreus]|uniref:Galactinol synthase 2 n=1 Tax=Hypsizygus marmoreus TaxID=39966 RepID=A0A369K949_HYPMA|nr:Galactinol synthase 2 [Hypsizygus marmoreus]